MKDGGAQGQDVEGAGGPLSEQDVKGGETQLSEQIARGIENDGEGDFKKTKQKILKPYVEWISNQDRASQFIIVFVAIPFSLGFLYQISTLTANYFWEFGWKGILGLFLSVGLVWCVFNENS